MTDMAFGSRRQAFLDATAPPDEVDYEPGLPLLSQLLASPKMAADLVKKAADSVGAIRTAKVAVDELEAAQRKAEAGIQAAKDQIAKLHAEHDKRVAAREVELAAGEKRAAGIEAKAVEHEKAAAASKAEAARRLQRVEQAISGAA
jgi:hypothetical protein